MALFQGRPERTVGQVNVGQVLPVIDVFGPKPQGLLEAGNGLFGSPGFRLSDFSRRSFCFLQVLPVLPAPIVPSGQMMGLSLVVIRPALLSPSQVPERLASLE